MRWLPLRRPKTAAVPSGEAPKVTPQKSLWNLDSGALLESVALPKPAPGGGSAAIMTGCMGTALLRKAFAISRSNSRTVQKTTGDDPIDELNRWDRILRTSANMDATRFDYYIRALMLPRSSPAEKRVREKAVEHAMFRATSIPIDAAATILAVVVLALGELPAVEDVVFSDAVTGIRLLNVSAGCLLYIAEGNEHRGLAFLPRAAAWRVARDGLTMRPLVEERLHLVTSLAVHVDSKSRLVNEFVKAAGTKFGGISQRGQRRLPLPE